MFEQHDDAKQECVEVHGDVGQVHVPREVAEVGVCCLSCDREGMGGQEASCKQLSWKSCIFLHDIEKEKL